MGLGRAAPHELDVLSGPDAASFLPFSGRTFRI